MPQHNMGQTPTGVEMEGCQQGPEMQAGPMQPSMSPGHNQPGPQGYAPQQHNGHMPMNQQHYPTQEQHAGYAPTHGHGHTHGMPGYPPHYNPGANPPGYPPQYQPGYAVPPQGMPPQGYAPQPPMMPPQAPYYAPQPGYYPPASGQQQPPHSPMHLHPDYALSSQIKTGLSSFFDFKDERFVKGAIVGAAATFLLTNESVQKNTVKSIVKVWQMFQGGVEELKERFRDAEAEIKSEEQQK